MPTTNSKIQLSDLISLLEQKLTIKEIAERLKVHPTSVYNAIKKYNLKQSRKYQKIDPDLVYTYNTEGLSVSEIAKIIGVDQSSIRRICKTHNFSINRRKSDSQIRVGRKYTLDQDFFETIDTLYKAYILGFIAADGSIDRHCKTLTIHIHKKDVEILYSIKKSIGYNGNIVFIRNKNYVRLLLCSKKLCADLISKHVTPNKTYSVKMPLLNTRAYYLAYLRGFIDGDGSISKHAVTITTASEEMMLNVNKLSPQPLYTQKIQNTYRIVLNRRDINFVNEIFAYKGLGRKQSIFEKYWYLEN